MIPLIFLASWFSIAFLLKQIPFPLKLRAGMPPRSNVKEYATAASRATVSIQWLPLSRMPDIPCVDFPANAN